jgi:hypothetical protein
VGVAAGAEVVHHILSYGGGVNSVALMILLLREGLPLDGVVFADTGVEIPETYAYLEVAREYLEGHGIPLTVVSKPGSNLYETAWRRQVIPSTLWRWSTRDYKVTPILRYYRSLGGHVNQYLAIARDEAIRMKDSRVESVTNLYPLVERHITRDACEVIIRDAGLPIPPKSACYICPFGSVDRWRWLYETHPQLYAKAMALEENSKHFPAQRLTNIAYRDRLDISLRTLAESFSRGTALPVVRSTEEAPCGAECMT